MKILVPFTSLHPKVRTSLGGYEVTQVDVTGQPFGWSRYLQDLWKKGEGFLVVEHDIEATPEALRQAVECDCGWSISPYKGSGTSFEKAPVIATGLGFTRFRSEFLAQHKDAMERANVIDDMGSVCPPGHWKMLDARLYSVLRADGCTPCIHSHVVHHHRYDYGCACGKDGCRG
ncbi:MAG: hypothetical protein KGL39_04385 [Patescibacteria group bacterium]|nr:hypothetical protein [Patescibacteria group bacterium]